MSEAAISMPGSYYWIRFTSTPQTSEDDQFHLMELGAMGAEEEDSGNTLWVRGSFDSKDRWLQVRESLASQSGLEWGEEPWIDWDRSWRDRQIPVKVTDQLTVCPPWVENPDGKTTVIRLEAKMAFGTGSHESTRIAALLLETLDLKSKTLLDVGTGTGILALYGALRGAHCSVGFDVDPVTGPCLAENRRLNPVPPSNPVVFFVGTSEALPAARQYDAIICNMIRTEAWPLIPDLLSRLKRGGHLVVSGQRVEDQSVWKPWFKEQPGALVKEMDLEEWWGFIFRNPANG